jgi:predicted PurR-regulated permease PerM
MSFLEALFRDRKHVFLVFTVSVCTLAFLIIFVPFIIPIVLASIFALGIAKFQSTIHHKYRSQSTRRAFYFAMTVAVFLFSGLWVHALLRLYDLSVGEERDKTVQMIQSANTKFDEIVDSTAAKFGGMAKMFGGGSSHQVATNVKVAAKKYVAEILSDVPKVFAHVPVSLMYLFIFAGLLWILLKRRAGIYHLLERSDLLSHSDLRELSDVGQTASYSMIFSNLVVGVVQALTMTIGSLIAGFDEWSLIFALTFMCSFFPAIGTLPMSIVLITTSFLEGNSTGGFVMIGVSVAVGLVDNVVRPYLVSKSEKNMNAFVALIGLIGAIAVFGFSGLFIGPFLLAFVIGIWPYFTKVIVSHGQVNVPKPEERKTNDEKDYLKKEHLRRRVKPKHVQPRTAH